MATPAFLAVTPDDFLRRPNASPAGDLGRRHAILVSALDVALNNRLVGTPCQAVSGLRVKAEETDFVAAPDVTVFCEEAYEEEDEALLTPMAVFEVLAPSTQSHDRGEKPFHYRTIACLRHIVLVSTERRFVDHYARKGSDAWLLTSYHAPHDVLRLDPPGVDLVLDEIYRRAGM